jgi:co-chaperonin GroES (HSP10)
MNNTGVRPIQDRVMVRRDPSMDRTKSGLHVPDGLEDWPTVGTVLAVGPHVEDPELAPGLRVFFQSRPASGLIRDDREPGEREKTEWERVILLREEDILGIVEDE